MPMNPKELIVKCYAEQDGDCWVAVCLNFNLASQGDSFEEAKSKLEEQIAFYVDEALQDKDYGSQLLNRRAPVSSWLTYYFIWLSSLFFHKETVIFDEMMPMRIA